MAKSSWVSAVVRVESRGDTIHFAVVDGRYCGKALHVNAGHALSLQYHEQRGDRCCTVGPTPLRGGDPDTPLESFELLPGEPSISAPVLGTA